jgi:hypothetical protein
LSGLSALTSVTGWLTISSNWLLTSLDGLSGLTSVGVLEIKENALTDMGGLSSLTSVGSVAIIRNGLANLDGLRLTSIGGSLTIMGNDALTNVDGLAALSSLGGELWVLYNSSLTNLDGLAALTSVGSYTVIEDNDALSNVDGLSGLREAYSSIHIADNDALTNLDGLSGLGSAGGLSIVDNDALSNVDGLSGLIWMGYLYIADNDALANLDGLSGLLDVYDLTIDDNDALSNVDGLSGLTRVDRNVHIVGNAALTACACGLFDLLAGGGVVGDVVIQDNATGCNSVAEILASPPDAECRCRKLRSYVGNLVAQGVLGHGQANSLLMKLDAFATSLDADRRSAPKIMGAFINEIAAYVRGGILTAEEGQPLIDMAQAVIERLGGA